MYTIKEIAFGSVTAHRLQQESSGAYAEVVPSLGGILNGLTVKTPKGLVPVIDGFSSDRDFYDNNPAFYKSNKLSPFPNRIRDGKYALEGTTYQLDLNFPQENNAIHGLLYATPFEVIHTDAGAAGAAITLQADYPGSDGYPFPYTLRISYTYAGNRVVCETTITNTGNASMPWGDGWHHYFCLGTTPVDHLRLQLPASDRLVTDERMLPTGERTAQASINQVLETTTFDDCFALPEAVKGETTVGLLDATSNLRLQLTLERGAGKYNYVQVYTPSHRKSIAIEPMTCPPDSFNSGEGLGILPPGASASLRFVIAVFL